MGENLKKYTWDDIEIVADDVAKSGSDSDIQIIKTDTDKRLIFGWASVAIKIGGEQVVDHQKDMIDPEDLEEAVYEYVLNFRDGGEEHIPNLRKKARMVESCVFTKEKMQAMGIPEGIVPEGWWIGFYVDDDEAWEKVKNGTYQMFSIEGQGVREEVEDEEQLAKSTRNYEDFPEFGMWLEENLDATKAEQEAAMEYYKNNKRSIAKSFNEVLEEIEKYNHNHDERGRFSSASGAVTVSGGGAAITQKTLSKQNVDKKVKQVRAACGNSYSAIEKEDADIDKVKQRGGCSDEEAKNSVNLANDLFDKVSNQEPQITNDVVSVVADNGGQMYGLAFRMKQPTSMAGKIAADSKEDGISQEAAAAKIKDAVRYTAVFESSDFVAGYQNVKSTLQSQGYEEVRCKNFFTQYENGTSCQKAVQCVYKNKDGLSFELQFHTYETQGAKEVNHPLYEECRAVTTTGRRAAKLNEAMTKISSYSTVPDGVLDIPSYS